MIELVYVSRAHAKFTEPELVDLLTKARESNTKLGITGLLLYDGNGTFIQALEGEEEHIEHLFSKISKDSRHSRVNIIARKNIQDRAFPDWKMGFKIIDEALSKPISGFSQCMRQSDAIESISSDTDKELVGAAVELLNYFKEQ